MERPCCQHGDGFEPGVSPAGCPACADGVVTGGAFDACPTGAATVALGELSPGQMAVVCEHCLGPRDASMLRAMGMRPGASVRVCRQGEPCIVEVMPPGPCGCDCRTRIGLAAELARRIRVVKQAV